MINVKGFDIDTVEGATKYLESEGIEVELLVKKAMKELITGKAIESADRKKELPEGFCKFCHGECKRKGMSYPEDEDEF